MKKIPSFIAGFCCLSTANVCPATCGYSPASAESKRLQLGKTPWSKRCFNRLWQDTTGQTGHHTFYRCNTGTTNIKIRNVQASCGALRFWMGSGNLVPAGGDQNKCRLAMQQRKVRFTVSHDHPNETKPNRLPSRVKSEKHPLPVAQKTTV